MEQRLGVPIGVNNSAGIADRSLAKAVPEVLGGRKGPSRSIRVSGPIRCALYARVSTRDHDQNPETQLYALRQYAAAQGWEIKAEYVDTASAQDFRGRKQWRALLKRLPRGGIDLVAVTKLDRAFRSVKNTYDTLSVLEGYRVDFVTTTQPIDTTTPSGRLLLGVLSVFAQFELELTRERINEGLDRARAEGKRLGRPPGSKDKKPREKRGYQKAWDNRRENQAATG